VKQITTYIEGGRTFHIFEERGKGVTDGFWGIEDCMFGEDGKLKQAVNGIQGHHHSTLAETLEFVSNQIKYDAMIAAGSSSLEAALSLFGGGQRK